jgi:Polynucleotide kinase 3 phosphatase
MIVTDLEECFYVRDAAGRQKGWKSGKPKDFSCSDRYFP